MIETEQILTSILNCRKVDLLTGDVQLTLDQKQEFEELCDRYAKGEPLQYVIGHCDFMGVKINVDPRVLIPRPETEILVEKALEHLKGHIFPRILDLGTGSGNIAVTLAKKIKDAYVTSVDISQDVLDLAASNASFNDVKDRIIFIREDMRIFLEKEQGTFDLIISNPPYIPTKDINILPIDVQQEPYLALDGGEDGLDFYRSIIGNANHLLTKDGFLLMEIGDGQRKEIKKIFQKYLYSQKPKIYKDYVGTDRIMEMAKNENFK